MNAFDLIKESLGRGGEDEIAAARRVARLVKYMDDAMLKDALTMVSAHVASAPVYHAFGGGQLWTDDVAAWAKVEAVMHGELNVRKVDR